MNTVKKFGLRTFSALKIRNYRLYFIGQAISLSGTWMQTIGQGILVLQLTHSGTALGIVTALQFLPILFLGAWSGIVVDHFPKRSILFVTQSMAGIFAFILGILVWLNLIHIWMVYILAFLLGVVTAFDNPTRQTFVLEMVGKEQLTNAIALNSSEFNLARVIGPTIAGILIASIGLALCFIINALSYLAVIYVLMKMQTSELHQGQRTTFAKGQMRAGLSYVMHTPLLRNTLIMMGIIGTMSYEFQVILPLVAEQTFHGNAGTYALLMGAMGVGAVIGGLISANRKTTNAQKLIIAAIVFGLSLVITAFMPSLLLMSVALVLVGITSITLTSLGNVLLQLESRPEMRGRVMALWSVAFLGSTPIGGPIIGWIGEYISPRFGLGVGGLSAIVAAGFGVLMLTSKRQFFLKSTTLQYEELEAEKDSRIL